ncbi:unnamed protein product [[Actinomadura] parvosata subsp. kistnae]|uniref:N-acetyltransferase domain-containing protein n=1 Tax=[Actinomadura] parvosata subsp. kistnae TaxID=1909395 RepID=A0A1U9ZUP9_9ACTN|nr:hypothetical protein [Nonomuraea sp. ATCC 55076]AQZ61675.1 hypothetical protein BKM31_09520 [Nonomuraea sp. ATCC 55076]SPL87781.1 unnamed protein product [Actinomadura parvosata subsp. kistnae]
MIPVESRRDLRDFLTFTDELYAGEERFVPPLRATVRGWHRRGVRLFLLRRGGRVVARTTLHTDAALDARLGRETQLFGLTEFAEEAAEELFDGICAAGAAAGRKAVFGPVSLLPNQAGGVITSGFGERGFIDSAWNRPYYPAAYEAYGFGRRFESDTWICPVPPEPVFAFDDARMEAEELRVHRGDRRRVREQLPILREMLNASFAQLGYYTEISAGQLAEQTDGLAYLLDEALLLYLTKAGRPVAFVLCLPDISRFIAKIRGNLHFFHQLRLLATRSRYRREAVLIVKGTVPGEQGHGYMRLLSRELHEGLRRGGYHTLRSTYVERDNPGSAAQYLAMGGRPLHGYTFYDKDLP